MYNIYFAGRQWPVTDCHDEPVIDAEATATPPASDYYESADRDRLHEAESRFNEPITAAT
jgi:hypothetical protein